MLYEESQSFQDYLDDQEENEDLKDGDQLIILMKRFCSLRNPLARYLGKESSETRAPFIDVERFFTEENL